MKAQNCKLRITSGEYSFLEMELPEIDTLQKAQELAKILKEKEKVGNLGSQSWTTCKHDVDFQKSMRGKTKRGEWSGIKCTKCGSVRFREGNDWGDWKIPKSENLL